MQILLLYARERGKTVVMLDIKKRNGENLLDASESIYEILDEVEEKKLIPEGREHFSD